MPKSTVKTPSGAPSLECRCVSTGNSKSYFRGTGYCNQIGKKIVDSRLISCDNTIVKILRVHFVNVENALEFRLGNERTGSTRSSCTAPGHLFYARCYYATIQTEV
jgi:hypothetical protein